MSQKDKYPLRIAVFYMAQFSINAIYQTFSPKYFENAGFSNAIIGTLMGFSPFIAMVGQPIWGAVADRAKKKNHVLIILLAAAAVALFLYPISNAYWYLMLMVGINAFFYTSVQPLGDAITLEALESGGWKFGPIRMGGTIAFAAVSGLAGFALAGRPHLIPIIAGSITVATIGASFVLPPIAGHNKGKSGQGMASFKKVLSNVDTVMLIGVVFVLMITMGFFYSFFSVHFTTALGGSSGMLGLCFVISAGSEVPFLFVSDRLLTRFGPGKMLAAASVCMAARWLTLGLMTNPVLVMASQVLHAGCFIIISFTVVKYISATMPGELKATGQLVASTLGMTASRVVGATVGGIVSDSIGIAATFIICAGICAAVCAFLLIAMKKGRLSAAV